VHGWSLDIEAGGGFYDVGKAAGKAVGKTPGRRREDAGKQTPATHTGT
jgi:hypothetical protein